MPNGDFDRGFQIPAFDTARFFSQAVSAERRIAVAEFRERERRALLPPFVPTTEPIFVPTPVRPTVAAGVLETAFPAAKLLLGRALGVIGLALAARDILRLAEEEEQKRFELELEAKERIAREQIRRMKQSAEVRTIPGLESSPVLLPQPAEIPIPRPGRIDLPTDRPVIQPEAFPEPQPVPTAPPLPAPPEPVVLPQSIPAPTRRRTPGTVPLPSPIGLPAPVPLPLPAPFPTPSPLPFPLPLPVFIPARPLRVPVPDVVAPPLTPPQPIVSQFPVPIASPFAQPQPMPFQEIQPKQKECVEVKRRRRRKGKCREGFFEELPGRTRFTTWRTVDCVTRKKVR